MNLTTAAKFAALLFTALALVPSGAHLLAMPNKIGMGEADYLAAQAAYQGWALLGIVLFGAVAANLFLAVRLRMEGGADMTAGGAFMLIVATLVVFFIWVWPTNQETLNWRVTPANWESLRMQWEVGHAVNAGLTLIAFCLVVVACLRPSTGRHEG